MLLTEVVDRIVQHGHQRPAAVALLETSGRRLTYGQLAAQLEAVPTGLAEAGLKVGQRVLFSVRPSLEHYVLILSLLRAGGILLAIEPKADECSTPLDSTPAITRVVDSRFEARLPQQPNPGSLATAPPGSETLRPTPDPHREHDLGRPTAAGPTSPSPLPQSSTRAPRSGPTLPPDCPLFVVQTSGTTGGPKYALHTSSSLGSSIETGVSELGLGPADVVYADQLHLVVPALLAGASVVVPVERRFSPSRWLGQLERESVTHVSGTPADFQALLDYCQPSGRTLPGSLRSVLLGSAPIYRPFLRRLESIVPVGATVWCAYAMTEMMPACRASLDEKLAFTGDGDLVGRPCPGVEVRVADDGELVVRGPNLFIGYWGGPTVTEHPTGDLGRQDQDGRVVLLGRKKDMIIRRQQNIYPALIEPKLEQLEGVRRCALVGRYDHAAADERVILVIEPQVGYQHAALERRVRQAIHNGLLEPDLTGPPDDLVIAPLPLAGRSRKVDKNRLRQQLEQRFPGQC